MAKVSRNGNKNRVYIPADDTKTVTFWNVVTFLFYIFAALMFGALGALTGFWPFAAVSILCLVTAWAYGWDNFEDK